MAVRFRADRDRWQAEVGRGRDRQARFFLTEPEAVAWETAAKAGHAVSLQQEREKEQRARSPIMAGTLAAVVRVCAGLDWAGKEQTQHENAVRLVAILGADTQPCQITTQVIDLFVLSCQTKKLSNSTIKHYLSALSVVLKRARRLGMIEILPLFPETRTLKAAEPRNLVIPIEWFTEMIDVMEQREQRDYVALSWFLWHMGCRVGEALALTWSRVSLDNNRINFVKTKGNMPRSLPIPAEVLPILRIMKSKDSELVFPIPYSTYRHKYQDARDVACLRLGLSDAVRDEWVIHTLRHTMLTGLAQKGWSAPAICQWAGHGSLAITQRYVHGSAINLEALMNC
jgi:integrase